MKTGIGEPVRRKEDARLVVGAGRFSDDVDLPRQAHAFVVRSVHAHARIKGIDTARANPEWYQGRTPTAAGIPLGRQGSVDEIAATCLFLVTDDGGFITGQTIHANGGVAYY